MENKKHMYERIRNLRIERNKTQEEIANVLGCSISSYRGYERGQQKIPTRNLIKLALYYGKSLDYILELTDEEIPHERNDSFRDWHEK